MLLPARLVGAGTAFESGLKRTGTGVEVVDSPGMQFNILGTSGVCPLPKPVGP